MIIVLYYFHGNVDQIEGGKSRGEGKREKEKGKKCGYMRREIEMEKKKGEREEKGERDRLI
jgi:hypothetical protein